jgi:hypothetical protein
MVVLAYLSRLFGVVRTVSGTPWPAPGELAFVGFNVAEWVAADREAAPGDPARPGPLPGASWS